ncbi:hypothetical protein LshimejAT787_0901310 [Lyophyllum shimeji]|uniref:Uncharacterized protein n=1 Tax=Lyophyllum shimeji TaxID=47721 RepID=A0A9P3US78_LYOSH|nr:hypothetical protein LshimejAT787_0901310 [Lyophyllum shimeji]
MIPSPQLVGIVLPLESRRYTSAAGGLLRTGVTPSYLSLSAREGNVASTRLATPLRSQAIPLFSTDRQERVPVLPHSRSSCVGDIPLKPNP